MATAKKPETPADETVEPKVRRQQVSPAVHIAYAIDADGHLYDVVQFGARQADEVAAMKHALSMGYQVTALPAGTPIRAHLGLSS